MADRFKPPSIDWTSPGDVHKRFKIFKQKCELIFAGPLEKVDEAKKVRLLLLWVDDKGLEIYNATTWQNDSARSLHQTTKQSDSFKIPAPVPQTRGYAT